MKILTLLLAVFLISCTNTAPKVKEISTTNESGCVYISDITELLRVFTVHKKEVDYAGTIGYQGVTLGGNVKEDREFYMLQNRLEQEAATINSAVKAIVIIANKSCTPENLNRAWETMDKLIETVGVVYAPVLLSE